MSTKEKVIQLIQELPDSASIEQIITAICDNDTTLGAGDGKQALEDLNAFVGTWSDRHDLLDSCDAVRKEREQWQQRLARPV